MDKNDPARVKTKMTDGVTGNPGNYSPRGLVFRIKNLKGDPHYVALGMAIGIFTSLTPTIPFHMALAFVLAMIFHGSKAAAVIGVWFSNPLTIPFFYLGNYKVGSFLLGHSMPYDPKYDSILELVKMGMGATLAMLLGGIIMGIPFALIAYSVTKRVFVKIARRKASSRHIRVPK
jgi:uncharacterized protein (DUF2062 family)